MPSFMIHLLLEAQAHKILSGSFGRSEGNPIIAIANQARLSLDGFGAAWSPGRSAFRADEATRRGEETSKTVFGVPWVPKNI